MPVTSPAMEEAPETDPIAEAITDAWGERCPDFHPDCHTCKVWKRYDAFVRAEPLLGEAEKALEAAQNDISRQPKGTWPETAAKIERHPFPPARGSKAMIPTRDTSAYLSLSQTMRRLAHSARREALKWEADGNLKNYTTMRHECDRLWEAAKFYLLHAKLGAGK